MNELSAFSELWAALPAWQLAAGCALLGAVAGSFLNVAVYRLPLMNAAPEGDARRFNLAWPRSHCPSCGATVAARHNVPLLSYLWLRGRCASCDAAIGARYPLIEAAAMLAAAHAALAFATPGQALAAMAFGWTLIALAAIDLREGLLPDALTLPLVWAGLLCNSAGLFCDLSHAVWGAAFGYLVPWSVYWGFKLASGREGLGYGDMKMCAALGAWVGIAALPAALLLFSLAGLAYGAAFLWLRGGTRNTPIPVGPCIAASGWAALAFGELASDLLTGAA